MSDTCEVCGWWKRVCKCSNNSLPNMHIFKPMWYEDIDVQPIYIESKRQLKEECKKRNLVAVRLL